MNSALFRQKPSRLLPLAGASLLLMGGGILLGGWRDGFMGLPDALFLSALALGAFTAGAWWMSAHQPPTATASLGIRKDAWLDTALNTARLGTWQMDLETRHLEVSDQCRANFSQPAGAEFTYDTLMAGIDPADRDRVAAAIRYAIATGEEYREEYGVHWPDGTRRWILASGRILRHDPTPPTQMVGVTLDLTEQMRAAAELRVSEARFRAAVVRLVAFFGRTQPMAACRVFRSAGPS